MDLQDSLAQLATSAPGLMGHIQTEEATKTALVLPFIAALGYNVFDPKEVVPEFTADVGIKKGEKIDYAIMKDGVPIILIECKWCKSSLDNICVSQLFRYYATLPTRIAVLTNGIIYRVFADLDEPNKMDPRPFLEFSILELSESTMKELKRFTKEAFSIDDLIPYAEEMKYSREVKRVLADQIQNPDEDFLRVFISRVYPGKCTQSVKERFADVVARSVQSYISERVSDRLKAALAAEQGTESAPEAAVVVVPEESGQKIVTTEEEIEAFFAIKAILRKICPPKKIALRDGQSYCAILFDDNNRKPLCRLYFNSQSSKRIVIFDEKRNEIKHDIKAIDDIYNYAEELVNIAYYYMSGVGGKATVGEQEES